MCLDCIVCLGVRYWGDAGGFQCIIGPKFMVVEHVSNVTYGDVHVLCG